MSSPDLGLSCSRASYSQGLRSCILQKAFCSNSLLLRMKANWKLSRERHSSEIWREWKEKVASVCCQHDLISQRQISWHGGKFFLFPTTPIASPRQGTRLARSDPRPQPGTRSLARVPAQAGGANCSGTMPLSSTYLSKLY